MTSTSARPQGLLPRTDTDAWWRDAVIYQIYPRSFADANGDGIVNAYRAVTHSG